MARNLRSDKDKAQQVVDVLQRRVNKLCATVKDAEQQRKDAEAALAVEEKRLAHAKASPDLAQPTGATSVSSVKPSAGGVLMNADPS